MLFFPCTVTLSLSEILGIPCKSLIKYLLNICSLPQTRAVAVLFSGVFNSPQLIRYKFKEKLFDKLVQKKKDLIHSQKLWHHLFLSFILVLPPEVEVNEWTTLDNLTGGRIILLFTKHLPVTARIAVDHAILPLGQSQLENLPFKRNNPHAALINNQISKCHNVEWGLWFSGDPV